MTHGTASQTAGCPRRLVEVCGVGWNRRGDFCESRWGGTMGDRTDISVRANGSAMCAYARTYAQAQEDGEGRNRACVFRSTASLFMTRKLIHRIEYHFEHRTRLAWHACQSSDSPTLSHAYTLPRTQTRKLADTLCSSVFFCSAILPLTLTLTQTLSFTLHAHFGQSPELMSYTTVIPLASGPCCTQPTVST